MVSLVVIYILACLVLEHDGLFQVRCLSTIENGQSLLGKGGLLNGHYFPLLERQVFLAQQSLHRVHNGVYPEVPQFGRVLMEVLPVVLHQVQQIVVS